MVSFYSIVGKKNKTTGGLTVKGVAWDDNLGGRNFDKVLSSSNKYRYILILVIVTASWVSVTYKHKYSLQV